MTVADLIAALAEFPPDMPVWIATTSEMDGDPLTSEPRPRFGFIAANETAESWADTADKWRAIPTVLLG